MNKTILGVRMARYKHNAARERLALCLLAVVSLGEALVILLTLGYLSTDWRGNLLFSDVLDRISGKEQ